jgi:hypothetical protein
MSNIHEGKTAVVSAYAGRVALDAYKNGKGALVFRERDGGWSIGITAKEGGMFLEGFSVSVEDAQKFADFIKEHVR